MGQLEGRARVAVPVLILILLSGCATRPASVTMAAPPPSARAEQIATATSEGSPGTAESAVETPRIEVETTQPSTPEASVPDARAETPAAEPSPSDSPSVAEAAPQSDVNPPAAPSPEPSEEAVRTPSEAAAPGPEPDTIPPASEAPASAPVPSEPAVAAAVPQEMTAAPAEFRPADGLTTIHFDFDEYAIRPEDARILEENATWLNANEPYLVLIEGHADERGTSEYNLALGSHRAKAAMDHLVALGVQRSRVTMVSYGKERPLCTEGTEECWVQNRRAQFLVKPQ